MDAELLNIQEIWVMFIGPFFQWQLGAALAGGVLFAFWRIVSFSNRAKPVRIISNDA